jgi:hypothetical protein
MAEIKVNGRIKVKSFNKSFTESYPYLHAVLKLPNGKNIDPETTMANAKSLSNDGKYSPTEENEFSINGNLQIGTFEKRFQDTFGIRCEVYYKKNIWVKTSDAYDKNTLSEANSRLEKEGAELIKL